MDNLKNKLDENLQNYSALEKQHQGLQEDHDRLTAELEAVRELKKSSLDALSQLVAAQEDIITTNLLESAHELRSYVIDESSAQLFDEGIIKRDHSRIAMYEQVKETDPELAASMEQLYMQAKQREEQRNSAGELKAEVVVRQPDEENDILHLYLPVPYAEQYDGLPGQVSKAVMQSLIVGKHPVKEKYDVGGILKLVVHGLPDSSPLVETLRENDPQELREARVGYEVIEVAALEGIIGECKRVESANGGDVGGPTGGTSDTSDSGAEMPPAANSEKPKGRATLHKPVSNGKSLKEGIDDMAAEGDGSEKAYLSLKETAKRMGFSDSSPVYRHLDFKGGAVASKLEQGKSGNPERFIEKDSLERYISDLELKLKAASQPPEGYINIKDAPEITGLKCHTSTYSWLEGKPKGSVKWTQKKAIGKKWKEEVFTYVELESLEKRVAERVAKKKKKKSREKKRVEKGTQKVDKETRDDSVKPLGRSLTDVIKGKYIGINDTPAITGQYPSSLYSRLDLHDGPIKTKMSKFDERMVELTSLEQYLEEKSGPVVMYTYDEGARIWKEQAEQKLGSSKSVEEYRKGLEQVHSLGRLKVIVGKGKKRCFSNRKLEKYLTNYFALERIASWEGATIKKGNLCEILCVGREGLNVMIRKGKIAIAEGADDEVSIDSVKDFLTKFRYKGKNGGKKR